MAVQSLCAKLLTGQDSACEALDRRYFQQAVLINKMDIENITKVKTNFGLPSPVCSYTVAFNLKSGATGFLFKGSENGNNYSGSFDKTSSELGGFPQYAHKVNMLVVGVNQESKCILEALDKSRFVVALQLTNGAVEIYGIDNGMSTGDYSYDIQAGGGGSAMVLQSSENSPENNLPMVYKSAVVGGESADFDSLFENIP